MLKYVLASLFCVSLGATAPRPNIVWIMSDDLGWGEPGLYPCTSPHGRIATPHLDKFGSQGLRFTDAYAGYTVCAPSRTTLFTGRHSGQFPYYGLSGTSLGANQSMTIADMLAKAGYTTGAFGKTAPLDAPTQQGFDKFVGQLNQGWCHDMYPNVLDYAPPVAAVMKLPLNDKDKNRTACMANPDQYNYTIDMFQENALEWLDEVATKSSPFFLYLSFTVPHAGGWANPPAEPEQGQPVPTDLQYADETWPDVEKDHAAVITYLDDKVGEVMQKLVDLGVDDKTVVFFASDNGAHNEGGHDHTFFNSTGGLRGFKRSLYEGGVRSPTMVRWPGVVKPGSVSDFQFAFWDAMPTFADLSGGTPSANLEGVSIAPLLLTGETPKRNYIFHTWHGIMKKEKGYGIRLGNMKGVVQACDMTPSMSDKFEIYNLTADPFETNDISSTQSALISEMKHLIASKNLSCHCFQC